MTSGFQDFVADDQGATSIEYGLIITLIFLVILASVQLFAGNATALFEQIAAAVDAAIG